MKKLGKKIHDNVQTISAYSSCYGLTECNIGSCYCSQYGSGDSDTWYQSLWKQENDHEYNRNYYREN